MQNQHEKRLGRYEKASIADESYLVYLPPHLPLRPPLQLDDAHYELLEEANRALGRLDGVATLLPDTSLFLYMYVRKEAVLSSQIEGTQSSLSDLLLYEQNELPGALLKDASEVSCYVAALEHGLKRLREDAFPLSLRLIREIHEILLTKGRGSCKEPGQFRRSQNWIGGTRPGNAIYVPPPPESVIDYMGNLEKYLHDIPGRTPALMKAAIAHAQFETIHPFLDGNGRLGRLLITLILCHEKALEEPLLYLSLYFKTHRQKYYDLLQKIRTEGVWEEWLAFFLKGVCETSQQAVATSKKLLQLFEDDRQKIQQIGRIGPTVLRIHDELKKMPFTTIQGLAKRLRVSPPTIASGLEQMAKLDIVEEVTGKQRHRLFAYKKYLDILAE